MNNIILLRPTGEQMETFAFEKTLSRTNQDTETEWKRLKIVKHVYHECIICMVPGNSLYIYTPEMLYVTSTYPIVILLMTLLN